MIGEFQRWGNQLVLSVSHGAILLFLFGVFGCATVEKQPEPAGSIPAEPVALPPVELSFPEYLLMDGFELFQHGWIPPTNLVGAEMQTPQDLAVVRRQVTALLVSKSWTINKVELGKQSIRLMASLQGETLEFRAVQGSGATQIFVLYRPKNGVR